MKKLLSILFVFALIQTANAQSDIFNLGIKGGFGKSEIAFDKSTLIQDSDKAQSWHFGVTSRIKIPVVGLYIQPEVYYSRTGGEIQIHNDGLPQVSGITQDRLDIPVLLGWRLGIDAVAFRLNAGPMGILMLDNGLSDLQDIGDVTTNDFIWGYQAGVGVDVWKFSLDARYEGNINDFVEYNDSNASGKISQWTLGLGYWF
ncbi:porin family protein [Sediminitomix flava]|uniref:Outer membrane protein with beta-barrel domain n=1 Tax=Sediminitomix flava TaxID=379075 RepID=A0A316A396_SEDFL|nr:porin family protein [Sediminitomix flava]PWJ44187.1 outer membrane protein with beta-barrel domain [Sediminitomix flava]